jgi:hypothetical protein
MAIWLRGLARWYLVIGGVAVGCGFEPQSDLKLFFAEILNNNIYNSEAVVRTTAGDSIIFVRTLLLSKYLSLSSWVYYSNHRIYQGPIETEIWRGFGFQNADFRMHNKIT